MLDMLRERRVFPSRAFSAREFREIVGELDLPETSINVLALMLAVGFGRITIVEF